MGELVKDQPDVPDATEADRAEGLQFDLRVEQTAKQEATLPEIPLFSDLSPEAFITILERMKMVFMRPGELVLREGDAGSSMFTIASGRVRVLKRLDKSKLVQLARLGEGTFFGEMSVLQGGPRGASVQCIEEGELFEISRALIDDVIKLHPEVEMVLNKFTQQRLLRNIMATSPLFKPFRKEERVQIIQRFVQREVEAGEVLVTEGEESDGLYLVLRGTMQVYCKMADGQVLEVGELAEGEVFGEISCLRKEAAIATVKPRSPGMVLRLPREDFDSLIMSHPQILVMVNQLGEERVAITTNALAEKGILI